KTADSRTRHPAAMAMVATLAPVRCSTEVWGMLRIVVILRSCPGLSAFASAQSVICTTLCPPEDGLSCGGVHPWRDHSAGNGPPHLPTRRRTAVEGSAKIAL